MEYLYTCYRTLTHRLTPSLAASARIAKRKIWEVSTPSLRFKAAIILRSSGSARMLSLSDGAFLTPLIMRDNV